MTLLEPAAPLSLSAAWRRHGSLLLRLCAVPLLTSCKPSEAFLSVYLTQPVADGGKGLTSAQLNEQVWPYDTYGAFVLMLPAGYLAEVLGYRAVILLGPNKSRTLTLALSLTLALTLTLSPTPTLTR